MRRLDGNACLLGAATLPSEGLEGPSMRVGNMLDLEVKYTERIVSNAEEGLLHIGTGDEVYLV